MIFEGFVLDITVQNLCVKETNVLLCNLVVEITCPNG